MGQWRTSFTVNNKNNKSDDHPRSRLPRCSGTGVTGADLTKMFQGAEYFSFHGGDILATSSDDKRLKFDAFIKNT